MRWRDVATEDFTWPDCWAVISNLPYDDPLIRAINGKDWYWYSPLFDVLTGIYDGIGVIAAVIQRRPRIQKSEVPSRTPRPWDKKKETEVLKVKPSTLDNMRKMLGWDK